MNLYIARMFFKIHSGAENPQVDDQLRLIHADDRESALAAAQQLGRELDEESTPSLRWEFLGVREVFPLPEQEHGTELYSRIIETETDSWQMLEPIPVLEKARAW